jgi:DHA1 family bicyclomycin/chloramphenicol resistance-like MFS transporter
MSPVVTPRRAVLAPLLAALAMFGPFCIDAIFPAFPAMAKQFGATPLSMQQTISVYLGVYAASSLFIGTLSDAWGRRRVVLGGVTVFLAASVGCALSQTLPMLLVFRALQGCSAGVGFIVGRAIIRDCFEGAFAQKLMAQVSMIFGLAPAIAPIIGAGLVLIGGWHALFWALAAFTLLLLLLCAAFLPETHPPENRVAISPSNLVKTYREIFVDSQFLPLAIANTGNFGGLFLYVAIAPAFVFDVLHLTQNDFPWLFIPAIIGLVLGSTLAARLAGRVNTNIVINCGYVLIAAAGLLGLLIAWLVVPARVPWAVVPIGLAGIGINLISPTLNLLVLDRFPRHRGAASSAQAFIVLSFNALLSGVIGPWFSDSAMNLAITSIVLYAIGFTAWRIYRTVAKREPRVGSIEHEVLDAPKNCSM